MITKALKIIIRRKMIKQVNNKMKQRIQTNSKLLIKICLINHMMIYLLRLKNQKWNRSKLKIYQIKVTKKQRNLNYLINFVVNQNLDLQVKKIKF